jgi:endonuclease-3
VLGALVRTILSQNTTDATSARAYASLRQEFGGGAGDDTADDPEGAFWERVRTTAPGKLETSIRVGGLADIKAARIRAILDTLVKEAKDKQAGVGAAAAATGAAAPRHHHHYPSLEHLRRVPDDEEVKRQLTRFNGVGPKSAACVLMFALGRSDFAVDTHVLSMSATAPLRWVPASASREGAYEHLNARVPAECKVALHVLMVEHGKRCPSCARGGRLATTKAEGGWLATERGRWAAEALASGEVRCPLAAAVARARSGGGGEETEGVVAAGGGVVVPKKEEEQLAWGGGLVPKKEEEEEEQAW